MRAPDWIVPLARELKLSEAEAVVLGTLLLNGYATREAIDAALREAGSRVAGPKSTTSAVLACKIRSKLGSVIYSDDRPERGWVIAPFHRSAYLARIKELDALKSPIDAVPIDWRVRGGQAIAAALLLKGETMTRAAFCAALRDAGLADDKSADVHVSRLRDKLIPHGLTIDTVLGIGWRFDPESRKRLGLGRAPCL